MLAHKNNVLGIPFHDIDTQKRVYVRSQRGVIFDLCT